MHRHPDKSALNASRLLPALLSWQLPAVLHGVPLPLLAQEVLQLAALLQLLIFFSQLQFFLLGCRIRENVSGSTRRFWILYGTSGFFMEPEHGLLGITEQRE